MSTTSLLKADSVEDLRARLRTEFGPAAKIVKADWVPASGFGRFKKPRHVEATVEVPDTVPQLDVPTASRIGIAALLADADNAQDRFAGRASDPVAADFDDLMMELDNLSATVPEVLAPVVAEPVITVPAAFEFPAPAPVAPPVPPRVPGDLIAVVGLTVDALPVAQAMAKHFGPAEVRAAGTSKTRGKENLTDRRSALLARAEGVERNRVVFCAVGFDAGTDVSALTASLDADQVWVVVDAGRKPEDTKAWVQQIVAVTGVTAVAVVGVTATSSPETVNRLNFPVGWSDGTPTTSSRL